MKIKNPFKLAILALCFSCSYGIAKTVEIPDRLMRIDQLSSSVEESKQTQVAVQLLSTDTDFSDIGLSPEAMGKYIVNVASQYKSIFKSEDGVVAVAVEVSAHEPEKDKVCTDYTQCVMVKSFVKGQESTPALKVIEMEKSLLNIKEVEITNFKSDKKVAFIIYFKQQAG